MENVGYYNGEYGLIEDMKIPMNDRVVYFGDGVYEATFVKNHVIFALKEHLKRLYVSLEQMEISFAMSKVELAAELQQMVNLIDTEDSCMLYWQISRGTGMRNHAYPENGTPNLLITVRKMPMKDVYNKTYKLLCVEDIRFQLCNIKTLNLIPNVLASQKAKAAGCDEVVFHRGERVTECAHSNILILKNGTLRTAQTDQYILPGITRMHLIEIAKENQIPVVEEAFTLEELRTADEVIVTSSSALCIRAIMLDGNPIGGKDEKILRILQEAYLNKFIKETAGRTK